MNSEETFDYLDSLAIEISAKGAVDRYGVLSTGERLGVVLVASRGDLIEAEGKTIAQAIDRLGANWIQELLHRWRYRPHPKHWSAPDEREQ